MYNPNENYDVAQDNFNSRVNAGQSPFKPEYDDYITVYPGRGSLKIQISEANGAIPLEDVKINVSFIHNGVRYSLYDDTTNSSGIVDNMVLPARSKDLALEPKISDADEAYYLVSLYHPAFNEIVDEGVTIYDRIETILPIKMTPCSQNDQRTEGK